jgi:Zn-finger nucleic acid-binding protein
MPDRLEIVRTGRPLETRWPCPVCVGVLMEKTHIGPGAALTLDYCPRCGGLWFDRGEVGHLARREQSIVHHLVLEPRDRIRPPCQGCHAPLDREAEKCAACGRGNVLACPVCDRAMERRPTAGLMLDVCTHCQGVWFDNAELSAIWRLNLADAAEKARRRGTGSDVAAIGGDVLLNTMFWAPDLVVYGGMAAGHGLGAVAEVAGGAAEGVFETVMEIIAGLFE